MSRSGSQQKLLAEPSGTIAWTAEMRKHLQYYEARLAAVAAGRLAATHEFDRNREACESVFSGYWGGVEARLRLLQWHGLAALDWLLAAAARAQFPLRCLIQVEDPRVPAFLATHLDLPGARAALLVLADRWPLHVALLLLKQQPTRTQAAASLLYAMLARYPALAALLESRASADERAVLARLLRSDSVPEAPPEQWPAVLCEPPWRTGQASVALPELDLAPLCEPARIDFPATEVDRISELDSRAKLRDYLRWNAAYTRFEGLSDERQLAAALLGLQPTALARLDSDGPWLAEDFREPGYGPLADALVLLPPGLVQAALMHLPIRAWHSFDTSAANYWTLLQRYREPALAALLRCSTQGLAAGARVLDRIDWDAAALPWATSLLRNRWQRAAARDWLLRYPESAARGLIPHAFGRDAVARTIARHALRQMFDWGAGAALRSQAARHGTAASAALEALCSMSTLHLLPATLPPVPRDLYLPLLPRLLLRPGSTAAELAADQSPTRAVPLSAVPLSAVPDVLTCLMLCRSDLPYAGLFELQRALTPESLAEFGRALFKWWLEQDAPASDRWVLDIQGLLGDHQTVVLLNRALLAWRQALNRVRAYDALNLIAQIGSDAALMHLTAWAEHPRYNDLAGRARKLLAEVAEARNLSLEQLGDRTVPDLGFDRNGELRLDFGPRQFVVRLDPRLQPLLQDAAGRPLKSLPSANGKDDAVLAKAARAQFADLRKQARTIASLQLWRFELAMVAGRRWSLAEARNLLFKHPLQRLLAASLVWGVYTEAGLDTAFRLAEDYSLADRQDRTLQLPDQAMVGLLHPIDADPALLADFTATLAEYEVIQPFPQLGREVFRPDPDVAQRHTLPQWEGRQLGGGSVLGLEQRGWHRQVGDNGHIDHFVKPLSAGRAVTLWLSPGWHVAGGQPNEEPHQVSQVCLAPDQCWSQLCAIEFSELQRDLALVAWHR